MNIHDIYAPFLRYFRAGRMEEFCRTFRPSGATTILDVGGALYNWTLIPVRPRLTLLNLFPRPAELPDEIKWVVGDGTRLPFDDAEFDIAYSNSVIEHLSSWERQKLFAEEIRRVGKGYYVQTPNFWFPVEPHFVTPFVQWLPLGLRKRLLRYFTLWGLMTKPDRVECARVAAEIRLLTRREMRELFPDAEIRVERFLFLPKSIIAVKVNSRS